jgi:hypothetical protein
MMVGIAKSVVMAVTTYKAAFLRENLGLFQGKKSSAKSPIKSS